MSKKSSQDFFDKLQNHAVLTAWFLRACGALLWGAGCQCGIFAAKSCPVAPMRDLCREALPLLGEVARSAKGVARGETRAEGKRKSNAKSVCHCETGAHTGRGNPHPLYAAEKHTAVIKRDGFPRRYAPRNDRGVLYIAFSFLQWHFLHTGDPSVSFADSSPKRGAKGTVR